MEGIGRPVSEELLHMSETLQDISWDLAWMYTRADADAGLRIKEIAKALLLQRLEMISLSKQLHDDGL